MMRKARFFGPVAAVLTATALLLAGGCGEKIAIPEPQGIFGLKQYAVFLTLDDDDPRQLIQVQGALFVAAGDALVKRDIYFVESGRVSGLADPRALCYDAGFDLVFVWEQGTRTVSAFTRDLQLVTETVLPEAVEVVAMATSPLGEEADQDALTFIYLADRGAGVVRRYGIDAFGGLLPFGLLARSNGTSLRDVHAPAGLVRDFEDHILVCDTDTLRNWVIRFDPTPDEADADLRGVAATFLPYDQCAPVAAPGEFVLGNAPSCGQTDWAAGPLDTAGVFHSPYAVTVAGQGRIYVADTLNDRVQIFGPYGDYELDFGNSEQTPGPTSIAAYDFRWGATEDAYYFGALVFAVLPGESRLRSYISTEYDEYLSRQPRPPE